jgi:hypothetical protein
MTFETDLKQMKNWISLGGWKTNRICEWREIEILDVAL